ncbi:MAG: extracellular solute-binding protein [Planctomycetota bacterium]
MDIFKRAANWILIVATILLVVWSFTHVGSRWARGVADGALTTTLRVLHWGDSAERRIVAQLIEAFEADHPGIRVQQIHTNDFDSKLKTMLASGEPPDLFYLRADDVAQFAALKLVLPVPDGSLALDDYYPVLLDAFRFDGSNIGKGPLYGIAKDFSTFVMYVNVNLFEAAGIAVPYDGWTWAEYEDAVRHVTNHARSTGDERYWGGALQTWHEALRVIVWSFGGSFFSAAGFSDIALNEPPAIEALEMIRRLRLVDRVVYNASGLGQSEEELFFAGRIGVIGPIGRWKVPDWRSVDDFEWDIVPVPHAGTPVTGIATNAWAVARDTEHPDAAFQLLAFLTGEPGQRLTAELGLAIPSMRPVAESEVFLAPGQMPRHSKTFLELVEVARLGTMPPEQEFRRILEQETSDTLRLGQKPVLDALVAIRDRWEAELASPLKQLEYPPAPWGPIVVTVALGLGLAVTVCWAVIRRERLGRLGRREERTGWLFISPWVIGFLAFVLGPMIASLILSFTRWTAMAPLGAAEWVGLDNYRYLFSHDPTFGQSVWITVYYVVLMVPIGQVAALAVALLMNSTVRGITFFRTVYFVPSVVTGVALTTLWLWIFNTDRGLLNAAIAPVAGVFGFKPPDWFGADAGVFAVPALVIMSLWGVGAGMVVYLAGLKGIPPSLYEAARIDGAGPMHQVFRITLPMLSPLIFFNLVMGIIGSFQVFTPAYVITRSQGTQRDDLLFYVLNLYEQAFEFHNMGYASAMAWVLFLALLVVTLVVVRTSRSWVYYEGLKS